MTGIDAKDLENLKYDFKEMTDPCNASPEAARHIRRRLAELGCDPKADATYEHLQEGLTRKKFDELEFVAMTYAVTWCFHHAQDLSDQKFSSGPAASKHGSVEQLIETIKRYLPEFEGRSLPANADPYHRQIFGMLLDDYGSEKLQEYCSGLAVDHAVESYNRLQSIWQKITTDLKGSGSTRYGLSDRLDEIEEIKKLVSGMTDARRATFSDKTGADEASLNKLHREIALTVVREELKTFGEDYDFSDELYKDSLARLKAAEVDMNSDATYAAIGMDKQTFQSNYKKEASKTDAAPGRPRKMGRAP